MDLPTALHARSIALKRRFVRALGGTFDPYPTPPPDVHLSPSERHFRDYDAAPLALSWRNARHADADAWQAGARAKLAELTGYSPDRRPAEARHAREFALSGGLVRKSWYLRAGEGHDLPVHLVCDPASAEPRPVMVCLHGTNSGVHLAWGEVRMPDDPNKLALGADYAIQAARRGYAALCIEQSCFGERRERRLFRRSNDVCIDAANHALLLGRTLLGERATDVSIALDWLERTAPGLALDTTRIHALGNSSGGTTALCATALDGRISALIASGCLGYICDSIARRGDSGGQNVVPGILNWLEMDDILALCAPRRVLIVSGRHDHIWPYAGAASVAEGARAVFAALGAAHALALVEAHGGHRFYPGLAWPAFEALIAAGA